MTGVHSAVEQAVRNSYARLPAFLASRSRDVAEAEDALADALKSALETWPRNGVPNRPAAWLLVAARRRMTDAARHQRVIEDATPSLLAAAKRADELVDAGIQFPDERLKLMFICAHPAIDAWARTPLMLQTVLGLDAARIASAFLVRPATMGQRLTRAKTKILAARIRCELPQPENLPARLDAVLEAIYAAYGSGWGDPTTSEPDGKALAGEALYMGRLLVELMPREPEARWLLALMLHCEARRGARRTPLGAYVPLTKQNVDCWLGEMIEDAEAHLAQASEAGRLGRFQLEAAIQSVHAQRRLTGGTNWEAITLLYEGLVKLAPTVGALLGQAAAVAELRGPSANWTLLAAIPYEAIQDYQPYWALAAHLFQRMGKADDAARAYTRAIGLCKDQAARDFLARRASLQPD
jgi:predicted RNA polymerase sigma factor